MVNNEFKIFQLCSEYELSISKFQSSKSNKNINENKGKAEFYQEVCFPRRSCSFQWWAESDLKLVELALYISG